METCKAIIQEGPRKGQTCQFTHSNENGYCNRHHRNYEYDLLISQGKRPCRQLFRGCNTILESTDKTVTCLACRAKLLKKDIPCAHNGCNFKTPGDKYCKKHKRDILRDEEKEKGIRYCDIARGCLNICEDGLTTCQSCLDKFRLQDNKRRAERTKIHNELIKNSSISKTICVNCRDEFEKYLTIHNQPSKLCL